MSSNQIGNNLLYLLSEKKSLQWNKFKQYIEHLRRKNDPNDKKKYDYCNFARNLSSLAYIDIKGKTGERIFTISPPILAELPFTRQIFLLTGSRSPMLLNTVRKSNNREIEIDIAPHDLLPDTVIIKPKNKKVLKEWLENTSFQGNKLSDYIKISKNPPAWSILEFAGDLETYEKTLCEHWHGGDKTHIKKIFNIDSLKFIPFDSNQDGLDSDLCLVKIFHQDYLHKYYLFSKTQENKVEVQPDWGKFLIISKQSRNSILHYNRRTFEFISTIRLPTIFERGLTLLSGHLPKQFKQKNYIFKNIPYKIAQLISQKLKQNLIEIEEGINYA